MLVKLLLSMFFIINFLGGANLSFFMENFKFFVLTGKTGSGKTQLLRSLDKNQFQILDIEQLARHNGSVFGTYLKGKNPLSKKQFLELLFLQFSLFNKDVPVIMEWKGKYLGTLKIPDFLYSQMIISPKIELERTRDSRVKHLLEVYQDLKPEKLYRALYSLKSQIKPEDFRAAEKALKNRNKFVFIEHLLKYYDSTKQYQIGNKNIALRVNTQTQSLDEINVQLRRLLT